MELPTIDEMITQEIEIDDTGKLMISEDVIRGLCYSLKDYSASVRETAACSMGQIGLPEALMGLDYLIESLKDENANVKSKSIWAVGRVAEGCEDVVIYPVVEALKSNMWKVKTSCFFTLTQFGPRCSKQAIPALFKLLKESAINKQAIAETIVKLGPEGESALLSLMNTENDNNYKLKSSIAKAFALTNIESPNIDFVIECLFKAARSGSPIIRQNALFAIRNLAEKADENITYLKRKNLIPFYYSMMTDKDNNIQLVCLF